MKQYDAKICISGVWLRYWYYPYHVTRMVRICSIQSTKYKIFFVIKTQPSRVNVALYLINDHRNLLFWCQVNYLITITMYGDPTYHYTMGDSMDSTTAGQTNGSNIRLVHRTHTCDGSTCSLHRCE